MKLKIQLIVIFAVLFTLLTACSSKSSISQLPADEKSAVSDTTTVKETEQSDEAEQLESEISEGAPPAELFNSAEEAIEKITEVREAGPEAMEHPDDFQLYEKDHIYLLKEAPPLPDYTQEAIMLTLSGTAILYSKDITQMEDDDIWYHAHFFWNQGYETEEKIKQCINRYGLEPYKDTKYYFGSGLDDIVIIWWENGDRFKLEYPADVDVLPEDIIEYMEVVRYDF